MPRYYCDYCDTYLTHDSEKWPSVRKQHNAGYKHKANVRTYYQQFEEQQTQSFIDQKIKEHLGQNQFQVGAGFNQFLQAPRMPMFRPPMMPMGVPPFGIRPPVLPPPVGTPGYAQTPSSMGPPGAPPMNMSMPPAMNSVPNGMTPASTAAPNTFTNPAMYQPNTSYASASSSIPAAQSQETSAYSQTSDSNH